jgi:hypothetical protein
MSSHFWGTLKQWQNVKGNENNNKNRQNRKKPRKLICPPLRAGAFRAGRFGDLVKRGFY